MVETTIFNIFFKKYFDIFALSYSMEKMYFKDSAFYREVYDWYRIVLRHYQSAGMCLREARMAAYDSIETRFNIKYSWARKIISGESRMMRSLTEAEKGRIMQNNIQIVELIGIVNEEYAGQKDAAGGE